MIFWGSARVAVVVPELHCYFPTRLRTLFPGLPACTWRSSWAASTFPSWTRMQSTTTRTSTSSSNWSSMQSVRLFLDLEYSDHPKTGHPKSRFNLIPDWHYDSNYGWVFSSILSQFLSNHLNSRESFYSHFNKLPYLLFLQGDKEWFDI